MGGFDEKKAANITSGGPFFLGGKRMRSPVTAKAKELS
jgi:hypothetical protein